MNEESIFAAALSLSDPARRKSYLEKACGDDPALRAQVEELLQASEARSYLDHPPLGLQSTCAGQRTRDGGREGASAASVLSLLAPCERHGRIGKLMGKVGEYEIIEVVGEGGMGTVLRAYDVKLSRIVAVKVMAPELAANPAAVKRFLREAQTAAAVHHDHVITIHAIDDGHRPPFLVMQFIEGQTLQQKIDGEGLLDVRQILRIGSQMAAGLHAAHAHGLIHRDVKPSNVLLENGVERVKITDFGLARAADDLEMTKTGQVAGTPQYMSPEQARGETIDARSDLFSLGSVLYAMCTGRPAFRADSAMAVMHRICHDKPRPIHEINPEVPAWLEVIVERLLAKEPSQRFQSAAEASEILGRCLAHLQNPDQISLPETCASPADGKAAPRPRKPAPRRPVSRWLRGAVAATAVVALFLLGLTFTEAAGVTQVAATIIRITTGEGTIVVEVDDPAIRVTLDGEDLIIGEAGQSEIRVRAGAHRFSATKDGQPIAVEQEKITIRRGEKEIVKISSEGAARTSDAPPTGDAEAQFDAVAPFSVRQAQAFQQTWASRLGSEVEITNSLGMKLRLVPPGTFSMGSPDADRGADDTEKPQHSVRITQPFYAGVHEVTVGEFREYVAATDDATDADRKGEGSWRFIDLSVKGRNPAWNWRTPGFEQTDRHPVCCVSWNDAQRFCAWLSGKEGKTYRLPTEAQWEYACRAGTVSRFHFGDLVDPACMQAKAKGTSPVGSFAPNAFGLCDMHGNVYEWCHDGRRTYDSAPAVDPVGPSEPGDKHVVRGGAWSSTPGPRRNLLTAAARFVACEPDRPFYGLGFRIILVPDLTENSSPENGAPAPLDDSPRVP